MTKKIVILFTDTGGGHRSAAEAIIEALEAQHGGEAEVKMVDGLKHYAPYPFNRFSAWYPPLSRRRRVWKALWRVTDGERRSRRIATLAWPYVRRAMRQMVAENPADVYVSVHWVFLGPVLRALGRPHPPVVNVVTDLISIHGAWCNPRVNLCIVPTERAKDRVVECGLSPEKVAVVGLPVAARFCLPAGDKAEARARVGWGQDLPALLLVGGGEGMGPLFEISQAISASGLRCELAVVAGRNRILQQELQSAVWNIPTHSYGFVRNMPDLMRAADILITKAGPGTICEAFNVGLPIILYDYLPGQETGNLHYVVDNGAGVWAPNPRAVVSALENWIGAGARPGALAEATANARKLARPDAARQIAELIWKL